MEEQTFLTLLNDGLAQAKDLIATISGLTGASSLAIIWVGLALGSAVVKQVLKVLVTIAVIAALVFAYSYFGLDAQFDLGSILGIG